MNGADWRQYERFILGEAKPAFPDFERLRWIRKHISFLRKERETLEVQSPKDLERIEALNHAISNAIEEKEAIESAIWFI